MESSSICTLTAIILLPVEAARAGEPGLVGERHLKQAGRREQELIKQQALFFTSTNWTMSYGSVLNEQY